MLDDLSGITIYFFLIYSVTPACIIVKKETLLYSLIYEFVFGLGNSEGSFVRDLFCRYWFAISCMLRSIYQLLLKICIIDRRSLIALFFPRQPERKFEFSQLNFWWLNLEISTPKWTDDVQLNVGKIYDNRATLQVLSGIHVIEFRCCTFAVPPQSENFRALK